MSSAVENGIFGSIARGVGGSVKRSRAIGRAKREYGRELKASRKLEAARKRRQKAEQVYRNPSFSPEMLNYPIGGGTVGDVVGVAGGAMVSQLAVKILPCGSPGGAGEIVEQLLIAFGLYLVAPESVRRGAVLGALVPPVISTIRQIAATVPQQHAHTHEPRELDAGAGLSGLVDFNPFPLPEAATGAASVPAMRFADLAGERYL